MRIAVLDDWQGVARGLADWSRLEGLAEPVFFSDPIPPERAADVLADFEILLPLRERMAFPAALIDRLPQLRMISLTGRRNGSVDLAALDRRGIAYSFTQPEDGSDASAAELALGLMLAAARHIPQAHHAVQAGGFQRGVSLGRSLNGQTIGIIGLGRLGQQMAAYCRALGMRVVAWSPNLTPERAAEAGAQCAGKAELLAMSDVISLHMVLGPSTRNLIGAEDLARMRRGCILVNTSRGGLIDQAALVAALREGTIWAALDVFEEEPLRTDDPILTAPNTVLTPHLGYCVSTKLESFYRQAIANILAFAAKG
ncbi:MAG: D-2-hydroxyacid dehydrogenase family protein [Rhodobacteraceae bacterium]|jgi:phosphoglycerate dehydrogenase-like enzyme|nr:D-2-hydroxyacid dehydrogenase family protein [Paracoccaceae bacterium]